MKIARIHLPRPPAAVHVLMRRIYGDSAYKRSVNPRRLRLIAKVRRTSASSSETGQQENGNG
jgi:hypothetical protein